MRVARPVVLSTAQRDMLESRCATEGGLRRPYPDGCWRVRIDHRLQQSSGHRRGSLLKPGDGLPERGAASLAVGGLEIGELKPA